jgi:hypothetical protein
MITTDDLLTKRHMVVERLKTNFPWLGRPVKSLGVKSLVNNRTDELTDDAFKNPQPSQDQVTSTDSQLDDENREGLEYRKVIEQQPAYSVLLGMCTDGLVLTLDLTNPAPGAILVAGDRQSGKTRLLKSILASCAAINDPKQVSFQIITANIHEYTDLAELEHCRGLSATHDPQAIRLIEDLYSESEQRRQNPGGQVLLLVIEELHSLVQSLDGNMLPKLLRLIKHGPRLGIWTFASLPSWEVEQTEPNLLEAFRTHLLGYLSDAVMATYLARDEACPAQQLEKGNQFCASVAGEWLSFWICDTK